MDAAIFDSFASLRFILFLKFMFEELIMGRTVITATQLIQKVQAEH